MKFHVLSDLHLDHRPYTPVKTDADVILLAGDIAQGYEGLFWATAHFPDKPVIYVPGNHEFYEHDLSGWVDKARRLAGGNPLLHVCQETEVRFAMPGSSPVTVLGCTLWTDFELYGAYRRDIVGHAVEKVLADYRYVRKGRQRITWQAIAAEHARQLHWLIARAQDARLRGDRVVVVTHHAPSLRSAAAQFVNDIVTGGFCSDLEQIAAKLVDIWVHGHCHNSSAYTIDKCMVVCNPLGYTSRLGDLENRRFTPDLVVPLR